MNREKTFVFFFLLLIVAVVIAFFICWAPFHTQRITAFVTRLLDKANKNIISDAATKFQEILFFTSGNLINIIVRQIIPPTRNIQLRKRK